LTGPTLAIDRPFDSDQNLRLALHLIQRHRSRTSHKRLGVAAGQAGDVKVIEGVEPALSVNKRLDQRALAGLPRTRDDDGRHRPEMASKRALEQTR
jgi:hypothetical protein